MKAISDGFKQIYESFVSKNSDLAEAKCPPGAGWGTAKSIKLSGNDEVVVVKLFEGIAKGTITAKELRWFTPDQLTSLKNRIVLLSAGNKEVLDKFMKVFGETLVISHKRHHSEPKQRALFNAYEAIKNAGAPWEKYSSGILKPKTDDKLKPETPPPRSPRVITTGATVGKGTLAEKHQMLLNAGIGGPKPEAHVKPRVIKAQEPEVHASPPKKPSSPVVVAGGPPPAPPRLPDADMLKEAQQKRKNAPVETTEPRPSTGTAKEKKAQDPKKQKEADIAALAAEKARAKKAKADAERDARVAARTDKKEK